MAIRKPAFHAHARKGRTLEKVLIGCIVAVAIAILAFLVLRWMQGRRQRENFATEAAKAISKGGRPEMALRSKNNDVQLSPSEHELFEDLINNRLDEREIQDMVDNGKLTEETIEKFLAKLGLEFPDKESFRSGVAKNSEQGKAKAKAKANEARRTSTVPAPPKRG